MSSTLSLSSVLGLGQEEIPSGHPFQDPASWADMQGGSPDPCGLTAPCSCEVFLGRVGTPGKKVTSHLATGLGAGGQAGGPESFIEVLLVIDLCEYRADFSLLSLFLHMKMSTPDKGGETYRLSSSTPFNKKPPMKGFFSSQFSNQAWSFVSPPSRENILKTAKALVEDTKLLVSGAASTPDKLAQAAQSSAATITQLAEVVKLGAASLGSDDPETQVQVGLGGGGSLKHCTPGLRRSQRQ